MKKSKKVLLYLWLKCFIVNLPNKSSYKVLKAELNYTVILISVKRLAFIGKFILPLRKMFYSRKNDGLLLIFIGKKMKKIKISMNETQ